MPTAGFRKMLARTAEGAEFPFPVHPHMPWRLGQALNHVVGFMNLTRWIGVCLSFPKIIFGRIGDAAQPRSEWRQWRQNVGLLGARAHLSVKPSAYALDCNTPHRRK